MKAGFIMDGLPNFSVLIETSSHPKALFASND